MTIRVLIAFVVCIVSSPTLQAAPSSNFVRVPIGKGASIEVPKNWTTLSGSQRVTIDTFVEAKGYRLAESTLSFAAGHHDERGRTVAVVNVHHYPENPVTQDQTRALSKAGIELLDQQIRPAVEAPLRSAGTRVTKWFGSKLQTVGSLHVFVHEHQQSDASGKDVIRSRGVRVWASPRSFTVTLAYRESEAILLRPIIDRMSQSIQLD